MERIGEGTQRMLESLHALLASVTGRDLFCGVLGGILATLIYDTFFKRIAVAMGAFIAGFMWRLAMMQIGFMAIFVSVYLLKGCDPSSSGDQLSIALHAIPLILGLMLIWSARTRTIQQFETEMGQIRARAARMESLTTELASVSAQVQAISSLLRADRRVPDPLEPG